MFEVGFTEIVMILGIALVVLGPEKLPKVAREVGRWLGRARSMARQLKSQLDEEVLKEDHWAKPKPGHSRSGSRRTGPAAGPSPGGTRPTDPGTAARNSTPESGEPHPGADAAETHQPSTPTSGGEAPTEPPAAAADPDKPTH